MTKAKSAKKVIVIRPVTDTPAHAIDSVGRIETACATSAAFHTSTTIQAALAVASGHKTELVANEAAQDTLRAQLVVLEQQEVTILQNLDTSVGALCTSVQAASSGCRAAPHGSSSMSPPAPI